MRRKLINLANRGSLYTPEGEEIIRLQEVGLNYYNGADGCLQDYEKAVEIFKKGTRIGYAQAAYNLGICYWFGNGVKQDKAEAIELWRMAGEEGEEHAMTNYVYCLTHGDGIEQDFVEAYKFELRRILPECYWTSSRAKIIFKKEGRPDPSNIDEIKAYYYKRFPELAE